MRSTVNMETNAQNTVVLMFRHVEIYFMLLDRTAMHESKRSSCFPVTAYEAILDHYIVQHVSEAAEKSRIRAALSISNLTACSLLSFVNEQRGLFALQPGLLQTIQCLDSKRIRELGQPDLDVIIAQIRLVWKFMMSASCDVTTQNEATQEHLASLMDVMQETLAKISHNVRALDGSSKRLSEILGSHDFNQMLATERVRGAIEEVLEISKRNIAPTLTFLNEQAMVADSSAMLMIRKMRQMLEGSMYLIEHRNIASIEMKLLSYAEVVKDIRQRLYRYVEMDREQRELYNSIEARFNKLHNKAVSRMDAKLKGKQIPSTSALFDDARMLTGMHNWSRSNLTGALLEMPESSVKLAVDEHIRTKLARADALKPNKHRPSRPKETARQAIARSQRVKRIKQAMQSFRAENALDDLYQAIHHVLKSNLEEYRLRDLYDAIAFLNRNYRIKKTLRRNHIYHRGQKLTYMIKRVEKRT